VGEIGGDRVGGVVGRGGERGVGMWGREGRGGGDGGEGGGENTEEKGGGLGRPRRSKHSPIRTSGRTSVSIKKEVNLV